MLPLGSVAQLYFGYPTSLGKESFWEEVIEAIKSQKVLTRILEIQLLALNRTAPTPPCAGCEMPKSGPALKCPGTMLTNPNTR